MKRNIYSDLLKWKSDPYRKPLILQGARQVGKTYIIRHFGQAEFRNMAYVNCHNNRFMNELFAENFDVDRIIRGISAYTEQSVVPGKTLIFLDEVQEVPNGIASLKYFCENAPEQHIVVAGSLLGILNRRHESFPVGKVNTLRMYPMTFEEFMLGMGKKQLLDLLHDKDWKLIDTLQNQYVDLLRQYYFVGGMPEAVVRYKDTNDIMAVRNVQEEILGNYNDDFAKHADNETQRIRQVWKSIPSQLAKENKKFVFGAVRKGARANDFEIAIQWLIDAGLIYKLERNREPAVPLSFYADSSIFKLFMLDCGLMGALAQTPPREVLIGNNIFSEYKGSFTENYVMQQLCTFKNLPLYYYSKENSTQEIDFIAQIDSRVVPIEVKAEENVKAKSLQVFINNDQKQHNLKGLRFSMKPYIDQCWMENVPLYAVDSFIESMLV